jgi:hypothetical protein
METQLAAAACGFRATLSEQHVPSLEMPHSIQHPFRRGMSTPSSGAKHRPLTRATLTRGNITLSGSILRGRDRAAGGDPPVPAPVISAGKPAPPAQTLSENAVGSPR